MRPSNSPSPSLRLRRPLSALLVGITLAIGCGAEESTFGVSGQVRVNGRPAGGVYLMFHSSESIQQTAGATRSSEDGSFRLRLPNQGTYSVTAIWPAIVMDGESATDGPDRFRGAYRNPQRPVASVQVSTETTSIPPFDLSL